MSYPKITSQQVTATLLQLDIRFVYISSDRNKLQEFSYLVAKPNSEEWTNSQGLLKYDKRNSFFTSIWRERLNNLRGIRADIVIIDFEPTPEEIALIETSINGPQGEVLKPRGIYMANIPEKPKTVEERLAALEELVAEGQKLGFYRSYKTPISY